MLIQVLLEYRQHRLGQLVIGGIPDGANVPRLAMELVIGNPLAGDQGAESRNQMRDKSGMITERVQVEDILKEAPLIASAKPFHFNTNGACILSEFR